MRRCRDAQTIIKNSGRALFTLGVLLPSGRKALEYTPLGYHLSVCNACKTLEQGMRHNARTRAGKVGA